MVARVRFVFSLLIFSGSLNASAQSSGVRAYVDRTQVPVNQAFTLSVEIEGGSSTTQADPELPDISRFARYLGSSTSQQLQIVNGQTSMTRTMQYRFQATREGTFQIGAVRVTIGDSDHRTDPIELEIVPAGTTPTPPQPGRNSGQADTGVGSEDLFLIATANKTTVYPNEPVIVEFKIYTRVQINSFSVTQPANTAGFWVEEYPLPNSPQTNIEIVNGRRYTVVTLRRMALFPTSAGRKTVDPMSIEAQVRVSRRSLDPFDDFFSGGSLFGRVVPQLVTSDPLSIDVLPLPTAEAPANFSGLVGRAQLSASVNKQRVETNEPVTLRLTISATGNVRSIPDPTVEFPADFEVYPPERNEQLDRTASNVSGTRTYDYLLVPRGPGERIIPPITLSYFDSETRSYRTLSTDPITLEVVGDPVAGPVATELGRSSVRTLREDIRFIHTSGPRLKRADRSIVGPAFWIVLLTPLAVLVGAYATKRHRDRIEGDVAYARKRRASRAARKRFAHSRARMDPTTQQEFFAETAKALLGFLGDGLNVAEAGVVRDDVHGQLRARSVRETTIAEYFACLDVCDRQRFSPSAADVQSMKQFLGRAERAMSDLERELDR